MDDDKVNLISVVPVLGLCTCTGNIISVHVSPQATLLVEAVWLVSEDLFQAPWFSDRTSCVTLYYPVSLRFFTMFNFFLEKKKSLL